jgi:hypothetical protein
LNILKAISDPAVFAPVFRDQRSWKSWFSFLAALFGLEMDEDQSRIFTECTRREELPTEPVKEAWLVIGRRGGKSFILALTAVFLAAFKDWRPYLNMGERATIMIIAADRKQSRVIMRYVKGLLQAVPMLSQLVEAERSESIDLNCRVSIEIHTCSFRAVRGYTVVAALLDEVAFWRDENSANPDTEVLTAVKPAMATIPGAMLLCASSPYASRGALWEAYQRYYGKEGPVLVWQAETRVMNPTVPARLVDEAIEADPSAAAAEYLAQFRTDVESYLSREAIEAVVNWRVLERPPLSGRKYFGFVDPSGGSNDSMTLAIAHKEGDAGVLDVIRERQPPFSPESVTSEFAELLRQYRVSKIKGDRYGGEWVRESFRRHGISYDPADKPKSDLYGDLLPLVNSGKVELLNNKRLVAQLVGLERRTSRAGRDSIDHGPGGHDDLANACAGALVTALAKKPQIRMGTYGYGGGPVYWHDQEPEPLRIRHVTVDGRTGETIREEVRCYERDPKFIQGDPR